MSLVDHYLFVKSKVENIVVLAIYVDDIIIEENNKHEIDNTKAMVNKNFSMKDLSKLHYFSGLEIAQSKKGTIVHQKNIL